MTDRASDFGDGRRPEHAIVVGVHPQQARRRGEPFHPLVHLMIGQFRADQQRGRRKPSFVDIRTDRVGVPVKSFSSKAMTVIRSRTSPRNSRASSGLARFLPGIPVSTA